MVAGRVLKTTNSGDAWNVTAVVTPTYGIAIHPTTPNTLYVAVDNALVPAPGVAALYKSTNGGTSVKQLAVGQDCMSDVLVNPNAPNEVFALSLLRRVPEEHRRRHDLDDEVADPDPGHVQFPYNIFGFALPRLAYDSQAGILYASFGAYGLLASHDGGVDVGQGNRCARHGDVRALLPAGEQCAVRGRQQRPVAASQLHLPAGHQEERLVTHVGVGRSCFTLSPDHAPAGLPNPAGASSGNSHSVRHVL